LAVFSKSNSSSTPRSSATASRRVLRLIAAFKFVKAAAFIAGGIAALRLLSPARAAWTQAWLEELVLEREHHLAAMLAERALALLDLARPRALSEVAVGAFLFAALFIVQGVGLALARRWAEYLTVAVTTSFLPVEAVALWHRWTLLRAGTIVVNVAIVAYLLAEIRAQRASRPG
jgi:uncharacterized membrane protein (DUF2068 family)